MYFPQLCWIRTIVKLKLVCPAVSPWGPAPHYGNYWLKKLKKKRREQQIC